MRRGLLWAVILLFCLTALAGAAKKEAVLFKAPVELVEGEEYYFAKKDAVVRDGPTSKAEIIARAAKGSVFLKLDENEKGSWYKLRGTTADGEVVEGWIYKRWLRLYTGKEDLKAEAETKKVKPRGIFIPAPDSLEEEVEYFQTSRNAIMREGPGSKSKKIERIAVGSVLQKLGENEKGSWFEMRGITEEGDTISGWIYKRWLKAYPPEEEPEQKEEEKKE